MDYFKYRKGELFCEDVRVASIAQRYGTPCYIYSTATIKTHLKRIQQAFAGVKCRVYYSVKANANRSILRILHRAGAGFDVVSGGELFRVLKAGIPGKDIIFAGVGKTDEEIKEGLKARIHLFNIESADELRKIAHYARRFKHVAPIALRINPDVEAITHRYLTTGKKETKFGLPPSEVRQLFKIIKTYPSVKLIGLQMHIGSQITNTKPYLKALLVLKHLLDQVRAAGYPIRYLDIGGGFGIFYRGDEAQPAQTFARAIMPMIKQTGCHLMLEPGRFIVGNAGILVVKVLYTKRMGRKYFVITDGGMSELIRPALYEAYHRIWPVTPSGKRGTRVKAQIVGPICETGDFLGKDRTIPPVKPGELLSVFSAGAYGYTMSSNYNARRRPAEILVSGKTSRLVTRRETYRDLVRQEI